MRREKLDSELISLHQRAEAAPRLSLLHEAAAEGAEPGARRFHLTHAWVFALVAGEEARAARLEQALREAGGL